MRISFKRNGFIALASMLSFAVYAGDNLPLATAASGGYDKLKNESIDMKNILFIAFSSFILLLFLVLLNKKLKLIFLLMKLYLWILI